MNVAINQISDSALIISFERLIDPAILNKALKLAQLLREQNISGIREITNTYNAVGVYFDPVKIDFSTMKERVKSIVFNMKEDNTTSFHSNIIDIPVCYDDIVALDLEEYLSKKKISKEDFIQMHTKEAYLVYMKGFLPGFAYLGGLQNALSLERKEHPSLKVAAGSIAIGGNQTGIYGIDSPGGWWVIGKSPICFFDPKGKNTFPLKAGNKVKFHPISLQEFKDSSGAW